MVHLLMKIMKKNQRKFLYQHHINGVIIVDAYAVKYMHGLKEQYFLNAHILMVEGVVLSVEDVQEKPIGVLHILLL